jgi:hypothetical protein
VTSRRAPSFNPLSPFVIPYAESFGATRSRPSGIGFGLRRPFVVEHRQRLGGRLAADAAVGHSVQATRAPVTGADLYLQANGPQGIELIYLKI